MSRLVAFGLVLSLLAVGAPLVSALPAPALPVVEAEYVSSWSAYIMELGLSCSPFDPALQMVELPTLTTLAHTVEGGATAYTLRVDPPVGTECPDFELAFTSLVMWPGGSGAIASPCGISGGLWMSESQDFVNFLVSANVPEACEAGVVGMVFFQGFVTKPRPTPYEVCAAYTPIGFMCGGVHDGPNHPVYCPGGESTSAVIVYAGDTCRWDRPGERVVEVSALVVVAGVRTTDSTCTVYVEDQILLGSLAEEPCPDGVGPMVHEMPWGRLLP